MTNEQIKELITRRRRQVLVHSCIYYKFDESIISDMQYNAWARELYDLQKDYPEIAKQCPYAKDFEDFDYSTGMNLPYSNPEILNVALRLLNYARNVER